MRQCLSFDGNKPDEGRILCPQCERRMADALRGIAVNTPVLLLVATKRASVNMGHGVRSQASTAPSVLRDGAWELYCRTEREIRLAAIAAGCAQGSHAGRSVPGLCQAILKRIDRLLLLVNAAGWLDDLTDLDHRIRLTLNPPAPKVAMGACPHCTGVVWGEIGDDHGICSNCQARVGRREVADRLLARIRTDNRWMSAAEYRDRLAAEGIRIPASTIRGWAHRGLVHARPDGRMPVGRLVELTRQRSRAARKQSR